MKSLLGDHFFFLSWSCSLYWKGGKIHVSTTFLQAENLRWSGLEGDAGIGVGVEWLQVIRSQKIWNQSGLVPVPPFRTLGSVCHTDWPPHHHVGKSLTVTI